MKKQNNEVDKLERAVRGLDSWLEKNGYSSYDHYDLWSSKAGVFSRSVFSTNKLIGMPMVGIIQAIDVFLPGVRRIFSQKAVSAEAMPYFVMGFLRLYELEKNEKDLNNAVKCLNWLEEHAVATEKGIGWGLHFDWQNREFIPQNTPCVTLTSYSTDAFLYAYKLLGEQRYLDIAVKTAEFVLNDLNRKEISTSKVAVSYTPICNMYAVNANSYAAKILYDIWEITGKTEYVNLGRKIVNYILDQQNEDGSWYYWDKEEKENFIDSFHTAFVLENLYDILKKDNDMVIRDSVFKGYDFYKNNFLNDNGRCRHYFSYKMPTGIKVDIRSQAEAIYCCLVLSDIIPDAVVLAGKIANWTIDNMQDGKGYFYFRKYKTHMIKQPYIRWAQGPMFNALTYFLYKNLIGQNDK